MLILKSVIVLTIGALAVMLGGMAAAWRRACVAIAHTVATVRWMKGEGDIEAPSIRTLTQDEIIRYTPSWVSARHILALVLLFVTGVLSFTFFRWYIALATTIATYVLMELAGYIFPNRDSIYYVARIYQTFSTSLRSAERFGDEAAATDYRERLEELMATYEKHLTKELEDD